jgi:predicted nucleic acid-binding protein
LVIYLDSSAIVKLIRPEAESAALAAWLNEGGASVVTSTLAEVEVPRALRRVAPARLAGVSAVLARISRVEIDGPVRATAAAYTDDELRSLDAIHLATAEMLVAAGKEITSFVSYDIRQSRAAAAAGFTTVAPGRA